MTDRRCPHCGAALSAPGSPAAGDGRSSNLLYVAWAATLVAIFGMVLNRREVLNGATAYITPGSALNLMGLGTVAWIAARAVVGRRG